MKEALNYSFVVVNARQFKNEILEVDCLLLISITLAGATQNQSPILKISLR